MDDVLFAGTHPVDGPAEVRTLLDDIKREIAKKKLEKSAEELPATIADGFTRTVHKGEVGENAHIILLSPELRYYYARNVRLTHSVSSYPSVDIEGVSTGSLPKVSHVDLEFKREGSGDVTFKSKFFLLGSTGTSVPKDVIDELIGDGVFDTKSMLAKHLAQEISGMVYTEVLEAIKRLGKSEK